MPNAQIVVSEDTMITSKILKDGPFLQGNKQRGVNALLNFKSPHPPKIKKDERKIIEILR